jgi:hypothetical protein
VCPGARTRLALPIEPSQLTDSFGSGAGPSGLSSISGFQGMLAAATEARTAEARGEGVKSFQLFPATAEEARARGQHTFEGFEYYCTPRAQHPRSAKALTWTSIDHMGFFDAFRFVSLITRPQATASGASLAAPSPSKMSSAPHKETVALAKARWDLVGLTNIARAHGGATSLAATNSAISPPHRGMQARPRQSHQMMPSSARGRVLSPIWSLAPLDHRVRRARPELQDQFGKGSLVNPA